MKKFKWIIDFFKENYHDSNDVNECHNLFNLMMKDPGPVLDKAINLNVITKQE